MTEHSSNAQFRSQSFLDGANADYIDQMAANHAADPSSVDESWAQFFAEQAEEDRVAQAAAAGPSWARADWPPMPVDDLTAALTGEWPVKEGRAAGQKIVEKAGEAGVSLSDTQVQRAVLDSIRAIMIIRAYRIRGHLAADLDPLNMRDETNHP
jgi:2-oxoglutarate dehydrogenase E1 component